ncbi:MAG: hypothetical protein R2753_13090 [Chitinophagales bacterium]
MILEEVINFYSDDQNFNRLRNSQIGDNLIYKYRALASFWYWEKWCTMVFDALLNKLVHEKHPILKHSFGPHSGQNFKFSPQSKYTYGKSIKTF